MSGEWRVHQECNNWYHILLTQEHEFVSRFSKLVLRPRVQSGGFLGLLVGRGLANVLGARHRLGLDVEAVQARLKSVKPDKMPESIPLLPHNISARASNEDL